MSEQPDHHPTTDAPLGDVELITSRAKALSAPIRWHILRACLDEELTNKDLADRLGVNPGSMLHHVRTLVATGFLEAGEARRGSRNAVEIPYRTTALVWQVGRSAINFADHVLATRPAPDDAIGDADAWRSVVHVDDERRRELQRRLLALLAEYEDGAERPGVRPWSIVVDVRALTDA